MKKLLFILSTFSLIIISNKIYSQGCVAIRSTGATCSMHEPDSISSASKWQLGINYRYYKSYKHFVGKEEQKERVKVGSNVINHSTTIDIAVTHELNQRWSLLLDVPVVANSRSSLYEHDRIHRYSTHSFGVGDIRFSAYRWMFNPETSPRFNLQLGLGIKFATGDYKYEDKFHVNDTTTVVGPVDQSIQLGDGGTGFTVEANTFYNFSHRVGLYGNFYYLVNPREQNGVSTARGGIPSVQTMQIGSDVMSVPDQYLIRAGVNLNFNKWMFSVGMRDECLPVHDLIGGSQGFRRPGYIISEEQGISYSFKRFSAYAYVPVALVRNRTQSVPDKNKTALTGVFSQGDAAFSDYVINAGIVIKF
jgi:hypothetical protein